MDKALLDYEVSIDADCKTLTVGKPFAIEGKLIIDSSFIYLLRYWMNFIMYQATIWQELISIGKLSSEKENYKIN